jgi:hypothetical protein
MDHNQVIVESHVSLPYNKMTEFFENQRLGAPQA